MADQVRNGGSNLSLTESANDFDVPTTILATLALDDEAARKTLPYLKREYFEAPSHQLIFDLIQAYIVNHGSKPPAAALNLEIGQSTNVPEQVVQDALSTGRFIYSDAAKVFLGTVKGDWLIQKAEEFCKDRALYLAIMQSITIIDGKPVDGKKLDRGAIPQMLQDALAITFDPSVGHNVIEDAEARFDFYHSKEQRIATGLRDIDKVTKGGLPIKSLSVLLAGTGVGKSTVMVSIGVDMYLRGEKVLYITGEMSEEKIAERVDANLLDISLDTLMHQTKANYLYRMASIAKKSAGQFIVKEYPTGSASVTHFRALMNELRIKKQFVPTVVFVDYLNIFCSSRMKMGESSYGYIKAIAEELRGFAVEYKVPVVTATQTNRAGINAADLDLTETAESMGVTHTADFIGALISTEQLEQMHQIRFKQLKNRFGAVDNPRSFLLGIDRSKMRLFDIENDGSQGFNQHQAKAASEESVMAVAKSSKPNFGGWTV